MLPHGEVEPSQRARRWRLKRPFLEFSGSHVSAVETCRFGTELAGTFNLNGRDIETSYVAEL